MHKSMLALLVFTAAVPALCHSEFIPYTEFGYEFGAKTHFGKIAYDNARKNKRMVLGSGGYGIYFVDLQEENAMKAGGYGLEVKRVQMWIGQKEYATITANYRNDLPYAAIIELPWNYAPNNRDDSRDNKQRVSLFPELKKPKDLEGIRFHIEYQFCTKETPKKCGPTKVVSYQLPAEWGRQVAEGEKDMLKGLFIGGTFSSQIRLEAKGDGKAEMNFIRYGDFSIGQNGSISVVFVDLQEQKAMQQGYTLRMVNVKAVNGHKEYPIIEEIDAFTLAAARIVVRFGRSGRARFDPIGFPELKMPANLAGIEFHFEYQFCVPKPKEGDNYVPYNEQFTDDCAKLDNGQTTKWVKLRLPAEVGKEASEEEKNVLKAIFIGAYNFRVDVDKSGKAAIKLVKSFNEELEQYKMTFTLDFGHTKVDQVRVEIMTKNGKSIFSPKKASSLTKFTLDWKKDLFIQNPELLRNLTIKIDYSVKFDGMITGQYTASHSFAMYTAKELELYFRGGKAKILIDNNQQTKLEFIRDPTKLEKSMKKLADWKQRRKERPGKPSSGFGDALYNSLSGIRLDGCFFPYF